MTDKRTGGAPRLSRRRAALMLAVGLLPAGALTGALWAAMAPSLGGVAVLTRSGERLHDYLGSEADHFFVAAFLMLGLLNVVAAVAAVLAWQWRTHRGPQMVIGLCAGMVLAAAAAVSVGVLIAHVRYGTADVARLPLTHDHPVRYLTEAPPVFFGPTWAQMAGTLLIPAATAALVYAVPAAATSRDDLGGHPPVDTVYRRADAGFTPTS